MDCHDITRRGFLQTAAASGVALGLAADAAGGEDATRRGLPTRPLGRTGVTVSILALGGWHIGSVRDPQEAIRIMHAAIDEGLTFFDNAWDGTRQHLEDSLRRLQTDHIDLWQFHEINYDNDPDWIIERGALREALQAQQEGKVRFLGFTGHKEPRIHLSMLPRHPWDTVQMPVNVCDYHYRSFIRQVIPEANRRRIACLGMKSLGGTGRFVTANVCTPEEALTFALSQGIASLVTGIDSMRVLRQNLEIARRFPALNKEQLARLVERVRPVAGDGRHERFKSTQLFDGNYHRQQHGLTQADVERS